MYVCLFLAIYLFVPICWEKTHRARRTKQPKAIVAMQPTPNTILDLRAIATQENNLTGN